MIAATYLYDIVGYSASFIPLLAIAIAIALKGIPRASSIPLVPGRSCHSESRAGQWWVAHHFGPTSIYISLWRALFRLCFSASFYLPYAYLLGKYTHSVRHLISE